MSKLRLRKGKGRAQPGQALVEFAIIALVVVTLVVGSIQGLWALYTNMVVGQATDAGARQAALVGGDSPAVEEAIYTTLQGFFVRVDFNYTVNPPVAGVNEKITVQVVYNPSISILFYQFQLGPREASRYSEVDRAWEPAP